MRAVKKLAYSGYPLDQAQQRPPTTPEQATSRWRSFNPNKTQVMSFLLQEQYQLCCYSEVRADELGIEYHIEHVENKSQNPQRTFDYSNLAASALSSENLKMLSGVAFGGHAAGKQKSVDLAKFVSCHQADCPNFFQYLSDGRVVPNFGLETPEKVRANYTIDLLNLNSPFLKTLRQRWWDELDALYSEHVQKGWSLPHLVALELIPHQEKLRKFFSVTRQFFGKSAEQALQAHAPELI